MYTQKSTMEIISQNLNPFDTNYSHYVAKAYGGGYLAGNTYDNCEFFLTASDVYYHHLEIAERQDNTGHWAWIICDAISDLVIVH